MQQITSDEYASELARAMAGFGSLDEILFALQLCIAYQFSQWVGQFPYQRYGFPGKHLNIATP